MVDLKRKDCGLLGLNAIVVGVLLITEGCSSRPPADIGTPESRARVSTVVRDRELELTALRAEMATTRIAAAKKEAELIELRDLVQQLRLENAESRQAFLDLRERAEHKQTEIEKGRDEQDRTVQSQTTHQLAMLKDTVVTLAQELGQLRQELAWSVDKDRSKQSQTSPSASAEPHSQNLRVDSPRPIPANGQNSPPSSTISPVALTVTSTGAPGSPATITVQPGDTLRRLATRTHTSVARWREVNHLAGDTLEVGQVLVVPPVSSPSPK